jgi:hypothetical protein
LRIELEIVPPEERPAHAIKCGICELPFESGPAVAHAYCDDGVDYREVCPRCLAGGPEGIVETFRRRAVFYREAAETYEELACEGVHDMPTLEELSLMERLA